MIPAYGLVFCQFNSFDTFLIAVFYEIQFYIKMLQLDPPNRMEIYSPSPNYANYQMRYKGIVLVLGRSLQVVGPFLWI